MCEYAAPFAYGTRSCGTVVIANDFSFGPTKGRASSSSETSGNHNRRHSSAATSNTNTGQPLLFLPGSKGAANKTSTPTSKGESLLFLTDRGTTNARRKKTTKRSKNTSAPECGAIAAATTQTPGDYIYGTHDSSEASEHCGRSDSASLNTVLEEPPLNFLPTSITGVRQKKSESSCTKRDISIGGTCGRAGATDECEIIADQTFCVEPRDGPLLFLDDPQTTSQKRRRTASTSSKSFRGRGRAARNR